MICSECKKEMVLVGSMGVVGRRDTSIDAYVCPKVRCPGYGIINMDGGITRWPAMTLMPEAPLHAMIRGALKFRDARA